VRLLTLRLGEIDLKKKPTKPKLYLCRPNKIIVANLTEAYKVSYNQKLGALNELNFNIPFFVDRHHQPIKNPHVDIIKGRYLIKLVLGYYEEYFIITKVNKVSDGEDRLEVNTLSLGYELNDKILREYTGESKNATQFLEDVLVDTHWKVGYVDSEFDLKYRTMEVSSNTVLEVVFDIAKTFNALVVWDTINRTVNLYKPDAVGIDRGFRIKYGKYLESLNQEENSEEIITRLKLYGKENISIHSVNVTGTSYIEDFSYFMYPFQRDSNRNVIQHSDYMSDELCHALLDYNEKLETHKNTFQSLLLQRKAKEEILTVKQNELFDLNVIMKQILDERDIANTLGQDTSQIIADMNNQQALIDAKENEILQVEAEIQAIDSQIMALGEDLKIENNFTPELIAERSQFIIEKEWQDENITDPEDLLKEGIKVFNELRQQKITLSVDIVNFLSMVTEQRNWDKLNLGDIVHIDHERLGVSYTAKITEIDYDFESNNINVTISNVKDLYTNKDKFLEMLYASYGTSTQVSIDKWKWDLSLENNGKINEIINNIWNANKQAVEAGKNQVVSLSDRGLIIRSHDDPNTYLVGLNAMIAITDDGGNTWKHAITSKGIVGERIYGKIIMGVNLAIEDEDGVIKFQGSKGSIYDRSGNQVMWLGLVEENPDCFGLRLETPITRVEVTSCEGFAISRKNGTNWEKIMWASQLDGTLYSKNLVAQNLKIVNDIGEEILNAETQYFNIGDFQNITLDGKLTSLEKIQIIKELEKIYANYKSLLTQASYHQRVARDSIYDINYNSTSATPSNIDLFDTTNLTNAYHDLIDYMKNYLSISSNDPLSINVADPITEQTQDIDRSMFILKFKTYYDEADKIRNAIENSLKYAGLQLGEFYNNVSIGDYGLVAIRSDGKYRAFLNATHGLALQKWENNQWVNKIYASIGNPDYEDGTLIAEDIVTKRLKIVDGNLGEKIIFDENDGITINGNNGEQIRLNANEGIAIDVDGEPRFWIHTDGTLRAKKLIVVPEDDSELVTLPDGSFISDLTVKRLKSLNSASPQDYVSIEENYIRLITGEGSVDDIVKFELSLYGTGYDGYPYSVWGTGDDNGNERGYIYKTSGGFFFHYQGVDGQYRKISLYDSVNDSILIDTPHKIRIHADTEIKIECGSSSIILSPSGVKIVGSRIDLN
jgi:phage minor structural protein